MLQAYYHGPDDRNARQTFPLDNAKLTVVGGANVANSFELLCCDDSTITMGADNRTLMQNWVDTLQYVIEVASERGRVQRERWGAHQVDSIALQSVQQVMHGASQATGIAHVPHSHFQEPADDKQRGKQHTEGLAFRFQHHKLPTLRLNVDINTMPPGSTQRNQFEEMFTNDLARAVSIDPRFVEIVSVKPAPGMDWLTLVEFDICLAEDDRCGDEEKEHSDYGDETREAELDARRYQCLAMIERMLADSSSALYNGFVTCNVDPTYVNHILVADDSRYKEVEVVSSSPEIVHIMNKYKNVQLPPNFVDISHFTIYLRFDGRERPISIPNPLILRKKFCMLWPFEVKQALGLMNNMQELWIEPESLTPAGVPPAMAKPIYFEPSARLGGALVISALQLKAGLTYDVECDDKRNDIVKLLSETERLSIQETFEMYDVNGDGTVSRRELEELIRGRTILRKQQIDERFGEFMQETNSDEEVSKAEEFRRMHYQQLTEAQAKLIRMFENADIDGDGQLSFTEFLLAEAYWIRCTLNPEHASLF